MYTFFVIFSVNTEGLSSNILGIEFDISMNMSLE